MRETRPSGSEGGATEINRSFLPLSYTLVLNRATVSPELSADFIEQARHRIIRCQPIAPIVLHRRAVRR